MMTSGWHWLKKSLQKSEGNTMQPNNENVQTELLTMEQQFTLKAYEGMIQKVSRAELEELYLEVMRQKMAQENIFKDLMRQGHLF
jgi:hypothetical protein